MLGRAGGKCLSCMCVCTTNCNPSLSVAIILELTVSPFA